MKTHTTPASLRLLATLGLCMALFFFGKRWYQQAETSSLLWLLGPTTQALSWWSGKTYHFVVSEGFLREDGALLIHKNCSGFQFFLLALLVSWSSLLYHARSFRTGFVRFLISSCAAYLLTLLANTARILSAEHLAAMPSIASHIAADTLHQSVGIFVYFSFLVLFSLCLWSVPDERPNPTPS
ncbi:exosortase K [Myxococcota bacterium]|nr:exosortase K [Myxococcota bacterium]